VTGLEDDQAMQTRTTCIQQHSRYANILIEDIGYIKLMTKEGSYFLYVELLAQEKSSYMQDGMNEEDGVMDLNSPSEDRKRKAV
jgi:hypothetical protein